MPGQYLFAQGRRALCQNHLRYNRRIAPGIYAYQMRQLFPKLKPPNSKSIML
jgi:hypothetical protein